MIDIERRFLTVASYICHDQVQDVGNSLDWEAGGFEAQAQVRNLQKPTGCLHDITSLRIRDIWHNYW